MARMCRPYSNTMELWTLDPNLHLSSQDTTFCLITSLLAHCVLSLFVCPRLALLLVCSLHAFYLSFYLPCSFLGLSTGLFPCLFTYTHGAKDVWSEGTTSQAQAKRAKTQAQKVQCPVDQRPSLPKRLYLSTPPLLTSSLEHCIRLILYVPFLGHIPKAWPCLIYLSYTLLGHTLEMQTCISYLSYILLWVVFLRCDNV